MKEIVLSYLKQHNKKIHIDELINVFRNEYDLTEIVKTINQLINDYVVIENKRNEVVLIELTNYYVGVIDIKTKGFGFVTKTRNEEDIFIKKDDLNGALNNDLVLCKVEKYKDGFHKEGTIVKVIEHNTKTLIGVLKKYERRSVLFPDDKSIKTRVVVDIKSASKASDGDIVEVEITNYNQKDKIITKLVRVIGSKDDKDIDVLRKIIKYNVDPFFSTKLLEEAANISNKEFDINNRYDLRDELYITIDGDDAKDFDDAVLVELLDNGNYKLGVSIADVSYYVEFDSLLDKEALTRGTSVYMPSRVVPMLPEQLSNNMCSLVPNEDRLTITCEMEINKDGKVVNYEIYPSIINSKYRMTYNKVNQIFNGDEKLSSEYVEIVGMLWNMRDLAKSLNKRRYKSGSINFETDEAYFKFNDEGKVIDVCLRERGISQNIIEEFMLKANQVVAEHIHWMDLPFIYRIHDKPKEEKLHKLLVMANALGYQVKAKNEISNFELQKLLDKVEGTTHEQGINLLVLRSMQKAIYSELNLGHYGLNFSFYTHFTSPIRRYPDLIVHRLLRAYLFEEYQNKDLIDHYKTSMKDVAAKCSETEKNAMYLEREVIDMKKAEWILPYKDQSFKGVISSITGFGMYVTLPNTVEGLVHIKDLNDDYYIYDESLMMLIGERNKKIYRIGDLVTVKVKGVHLLEGDIDFFIAK